MNKFSKKIVSVMLSVLLVLTVMPFGSLTAQADELSDAKAAYTAKVTQMYNGTKLYKNALPAYLAYVEACKDGAGADEAAALSSATAEMEEFVSYTGSETVKVNGTTASGCYSNVLWAESPTALEYSNLEFGFIDWDNGLLTYTGDLYIYQPSAVVLYDGKTEAKIPVLFAERESHGNWCFRYGHVSEAGDHLKTDWRGHSTSPKGGTNVDGTTRYYVSWPTSSTYYIPKDDSDESRFWDAEDTSSSAGGHGANSDFYNFRNALVFDIDNGKDYRSVTDKNEYKGISNYKKISKFEWNVKAYWGNLVTGNGHYAKGDNNLTTRNPVYVVNYKKLLDKIDLTLEQKRDSFLVDNESFQSGNSVGFFGTFDNVLSLDPTDTSKYNYELDPEAATIKAGNDINEACIDLDEITSTAAAMSTLVSNINRYEAMMADNPYRYNLAETYKLYIKAKECFDAYIFGQKNDEERDADFLSYLASVSNDFDTALSSFATFASYTKDGQGNKTFTADAIEGDFVLGTDEKLFPNDTVTGEAASNSYKSYGAFDNVLYVKPGISDSQHRAIKPFDKSEGYCCMAKIYYSDKMVLLYNGVKNPTFPVMLLTGNTGWWNHTARLHIVYPTSATPYTGDDLSGIEDNYSKTAGDSSFRIKTQQNAYSSGSSYYTYWRGLSSTADYTVSDMLNWAWNWTAINTSGNIKNLGVVDGRSSGSTFDYNVETNNDSLDLNRDANDKYSSSAATMVEYYAHPFSSTDTGADKYTRVYNNMNWYVGWHYDGNLGGNHGCHSVIGSTGTDIKILNVVPAMEAKASLIENNSVQDILGAIFQYDKDSADVINFLTAIDKVGSFDPNNSKYDYTATTSGDYEYSTNAGIEQACKDMDDLIEATDEALNYIDTTTDSDNSSVNDGKVNKPTDKESKSTDTTDPGEGWYADLRRALIDPLEPDSCTDEAAYAAYKTVLDKAQDAVAYSATSKINGGAGVDYEESYNGQTIPAIAAELIAATETFKNAPAKHIYSYEDENENQLSTWDCSSNAAHKHETADMSAYNELEIAYQTIDPEAYDNFENLVAAKYDGSAYDDSSEEAKDYSDLSFKEVKTKKTKKGGTPQDFVDQGVMNLLEAINTAATENDGEHLSSYKVNFNVQVAGEEASRVLINQEYKYGERPTLNAADSPTFNLYGGQCYKWSIKIGDGEERFIDSTSSVFDCTVQRDCTITAYANKALAGDQAKITIIGPTGATLDVVHAAKSASVAFSFDSTSNKATVSIGGVNYEIASTPSYTVTGVKVNGSEDYAGQSGLTVQGLLDTFSAKELRIAPIKTVAHKEATFTITANGTGGTVNNNNDAGTANTLSGIVYDTKIRINYTPDTSKGTYYGMVINEAEMSGGTVANYIPITYGDEYYFRAICDMNIYPLYQRTLDGGAKAYYVDDGSADGVRITDKDSVYRLQHKLPFVISFMDGKRTVDGSVVEGNVPGKFFFRCLYTQGLPENVKVTEAGWVYFRCVNNDIESAVGALLPSEADLTVNNTKTVTEGDYTATIGRTASTKLNTAEVQETHQYSFSSKDSAHTYILGRGYVKYEYTFSESVEHDGSTTTVNAPIEAISYGRADFYLNSNS